MNLELIQPVVDAVLYEGYILYPYRPSAVKNRQRWTFGGIYPKIYSEATDGGEPCLMQTQCLVEGEPDSTLEIKLRFLQPVLRQVAERSKDREIWPEDDNTHFELVPMLNLGNQQYSSWQEAVEREVEIPEYRLGELLEQCISVPFSFPARNDVEPIRDQQGQLTGAVEFTQIGIEGRVDLRLEKLTERVHRVSVRIENFTDIEPISILNREQASLYSFASTHTLLGIRNGVFHSLMDPPEALKDAAESCDNRGAYPVLVGALGSRDCMLSSPIILYDHPEVAPESPGDLFDATEIDEILSLRILAMTDAEKREMAATDARAASMLARTEALNCEDFMRMHGTLRTPQTDTDHFYDSALETVKPQDIGFRTGDRVRLRPKAGGDIMDLVLDGKTAVVEAIERDFEDRMHIAVTLDDDPGRDLGIERMPGHRFFFSPEEIEHIQPASGAS